MKDLRLYQIYYNEETRRQLDPGFIPLDNTANERPDWFEFGPIRRLLQSHHFHDETWIGVFSPKFFQKTGMSSGEVATEVQKANADVVSFSPWFAHIALFKNIYLQGDHFHPGFLYLFKRYMSEQGLDVGILEEFMTARQAIYSNYFVAPYRVWRDWVVLADALFRMAENPLHPLGPSLNYTTFYSGQKTYPQKIFVLERVISLLIQSKGLSVAFAANLQKGALGLGFKNTTTSIAALSALDDLKHQLQKEPSLGLLAEYDALAQEMLALRDEFSEGVPAEALTA